MATINSALNQFAKQSDLLSEMMKYCTIRELLTVQVRVCKLWCTVGTDVAKRLMICEAEVNLKSKLSKFLKLTGGKFEDYFPFYPQVKAKQQKLLGIASTSREFYKLVNEYLIEKVEVCFAGCVGINKFSPNIPQEFKKDIAGKVFAFFEIEKKESTNGFAPWSEEGIKCFPIELFNIKVEGNNILGEKNKESYFVPFKGKKLLEFVLIPKVEKKKTLSFIFSRDPVHCWPLSRETFYWRPLSSETETRGALWLNDIYKLSYDSKAQKEESPNVKTP